MITNRELRKRKFIQKAQEVHGNKYDYSKTDYISSQMKVVIICPEHGDFSVRPNNHTINGSGCPRCNKFGIPTQEEFIKEAQEKHPSLDFSKVIYQGRLEPIIVICSYHGPYRTNPRSILNGHGCRQCNTTALGYDGFLRSAKEIWGDAYQFEEFEYENNQTKIQVICSVHGPFITTPAAILDRHGCRLCYQEGKVFDTAGFIEKAKGTHGSLYDYGETNYKVSTTNISILCVRCNRSFNQLPGNHLQGAGCPHCGSSIVQNDLYDFLTSITEVHFNDKSILTPLEIDCYLPEYELGIEYNGLYWHSEGHNNRYGFSTDKNRHQLKARVALEKGVRLLQFWEHEWATKQALIKSMILHRIGVVQRKLNARHLTVTRITDREARDFYNRNHLQGHRSAKLHLSLGGVILLSMAPLGIDEWEIIRIASEQMCVVRGGIAKLLTHFIRTYHPKRIFTFADLRYSVGDLYSKLGFSLLHMTRPNYFYYKGKIFYSRHQCQKKKLHKLLENFNPDLSESVNMFNHGFRRVWDAGHLKFVMNFL